MAPDGFVTERLSVGTGEGILVRVIGHLLGCEGVGLVARFGLLVKGIVLDIGCNPLLLSVDVVLLTAVSTVGNGVLRLPSSPLRFRPFHMGDQAARIAG